MKRERSLATVIRDRNKAAADLKRETASFVKADKAGRKTPPYTVIFEKGPKSWGARVVELPGCIAAGETLEETARLIAQAIPMHVEGHR